MPDPKIDDRSDEMEHDLHKLEEHIADAEKKLEGPKEAAGVTDDDAEQAAPDGAQDGPGERGDDVDQRGDEAADDPDERVDEELANPT